MNFLSVEKKRQLEWKLTTKTLPREARVPGLYRSRMYPFCLPLEYASYNLFHEIRDEALRYFEEKGIIWHSSALPGPPTNHLCSSQIFAVNLLFPFMNQPEALAACLKLTGRGFEVWMQINIIRLARLFSLRFSSNRTALLHYAVTAALS